jgi:hypothetical protein
LTRKRLLNPPLKPKSIPFAGGEPWVKGWMSYQIYRCYLQAK